MEEFKPIFQENICTALEDYLCWQTARIHKLPNDDLFGMCIKSLAIIDEIQKVFDGAKSMAVSFCESEINSRKDQNETK